MSLTSLIQNDNSWLMQQAYCTDLPNDLKAFAVQLNNELVRCNRLYPPAFEGFDFRLSGMAMTYAFRWWIDSSLDWYKTSIARIGAVKTKNNEWFLRALRLGVQDEQARAACCVLMAAFDSIGRGNPVLGSNRLLQSGTIDNTQRAVMGHATYRLVAQDIVNLSSRLTNDLRGKFPVDGPYHSNPTFAQSERCGGADAQGIMGRYLIEIKTSAKSQPVDWKDLLKQVAYAALDTDNRYHLKGVICYYPRHGYVTKWDFAQFATPPRRLMEGDKLLEAVKKMRRDFHMDTYGHYDDDDFDDWLRHDELPDSAVGGFLHD